jgi:hypothetical protein
MAVNDPRPDSTRSIINALDELLEKGEAIAQLLLALGNKMDALIDAVNRGKLK